MAKIDNKIRDILIVKLSPNYVVLITHLFIIILGLIIILNNQKTIFFIISAILFPITYGLFPTKIIVYKKTILIEYFLGIRENFKLSSMKKLRYTPPGYLQVEHISLKFKKRIYILAFLDYRKYTLLKTKIKYYKSEKCYT